MICQKKLFISHKISEHGKIVESLISILNDFVRPEELEVFSSSSIKAGDDYQEKIMHALDDTDLLLLMANYSTPPQINDWCIFETGYFSSKITEQDNKKNYKPGQRGRLATRSNQKVQVR